MEIEDPAPETVAAVADGREWTLPRRIAFRFCFCFLISIFLPMPFGALPGTQPIADAYESLWKGVTPWVGEHLLHLSTPVTIAISGSGDMTHNWVKLLCQLVLSLIAAVAWSLLDRRRTLHPWWEEGLRIYLRYGLAFDMFIYGFAKVFPSQFPPLTTEQLMSPLGRFSPMALLWAFMGASQGYTILAGLAEVSAGLLLLFRRTTTLGALVCAGVMTNVLALNLFYDVPVKLFSAELVLTALFLLLPDAGRLANVLVLNRPAPARDYGMPPAPRRLVVGGWVAKAALLIYFFAFSEYVPNYPWQKDPPPLLGIYEVESFSLDGQSLPATQLEPQRWRRVIFGRYRGFTAQKMDDTSIRWTVRSVDEKTGKIQLVGRDGPWKYPIGFERVDGGLILQGRFPERSADQILEHDVVARLRQVADPKFELTTRGFHCVTEFPYQRF